MEEVKEDLSALLMYD